MRSIKQMNRNLIVIAILSSFIGGTNLSAQINARLFQHPDVSSSQITFVYAGDIWVAPKSGGLASKLSSPAGPEQYPKFSADGSEIAFSGNYDGNTDVYVIPSSGGIPLRLTFHGMNDRVIDWHPVENKILFASSRESGRQRFNQFFLISQEGGMAEKMSMPHAEFGSFSQEGNLIAYTDKSRLTRTWKRYRGGMAPDIILYDLESRTSEYVTETAANEELPMWHGNKLYFLSDRGTENRFNIWSMDLKTKESRQITSFADHDVHWPSMGPENIVFEAGGKLYLMDLINDQYEQVEIQVITDYISLAPRKVNTAKNLMGASVSPDGKRAVVNARGEVFSVPAEHGFIKNLSSTSDVAERYPEWSPDGKSILYWSDRSGEYELMQLDPESGNEEQLTHLGPGFRYQPHWSPDSKRVAFIDQSMQIWIYDIELKTTTRVDQGKWINHGGLSNFRFSWSSDSKWLAYSRVLPNQTSAIFLYDLRLQALHQVTSGFYNAHNPVFDPDDSYLYLTTDRKFSPVYSDFGNEFIYPNSTQVAAISLREDIPSPLEPRNDEVSRSEKEEDKGKEPEKNKKKEKRKGNNEEEEESKNEEPLEIDIEGFESRMVILPPAPGNYTNVQAISGKIIYHHFPNSGSDGKNKALKYFDLEEREEKTILSDADGFRLASGGKKILVVKKGQLAILDISPDQLMDKPLRIAEMEMNLDPKKEFKQIFNDAWRIERDYFYDKGMHGVDWELMKERYGSMIDDAVTRWDVNFILGELIGELNASHTYRGGGDTERSKMKNVGYLGVDWTIDQGHFKIKSIIELPSWETEARSPLSLPGVDVKQGDYVLAVNGQALDTGKEPYAAFQGLGGKTVELTVSSNPGVDDNRNIIVKLMGNETRLRHLAWIESNRKTVEEATDGRVGYIYVRSTGRDGQNELVRQFSPQFNKDGLIIDERFNSGGQIPDRFIELLNRKPLAFWAVRDASDQQWPPVGHFGPKVMLINGWSGSGGDAFPDYFRKADLGPLVGSRTWGGLIGISGAPQLVDGGMVTVPTFRMFDPDGAWFREGHGVEPDIEIREDAGELARGTDVQLEKAIEVIKKALEEKPYVRPQHPPVEER